MRYVAAFRTYAWDSDIAEVAGRFFRSIPDAVHVVLADETRGNLNIPSSYKVISHTEASESIGLPNHPAGQSLWFNVDYGIYFLQQTLPDFDYYILSESDLVVNLSLTPMMDEIIQNDIDFVAHEVCPAGRDWFWYNNGLYLSDRPWRSLLYFMVLSARTARLLYEGRRALALKFDSNELAEWPFCEVFVATTLSNLSHIKQADIGSFADTKNLYFRPRYVLTDPRVNRPGSLAHSVLGRGRFIQTMLVEHRPSDIFRDGSELQQALSPFGWAEIDTELREALVKAYEHGALGRLNALVSCKDSHAAQIADVALSKPALVSSVSRYSRFDDRQLDACVANSQIIVDDYAFHTEREWNPWWLVDLTSVYYLHEIRLVNRRQHEYRFRCFYIELSMDSHIWTCSYVKLTFEDVSSDLDKPFLISFSESTMARYVRITLLGYEPFHLRKISIFGVLHENSSR